MIDLFVELTQIVRATGNAAESATHLRVAMQKDDARGEVQHKKELLAGLAAIESKAKSGSGLL